nr:MAG TPA: hypothetical protein [Caudoviricetes sp.]
MDNKNKYPAFTFNSKMHKIEGISCLFLKIFLCSLTIKYRYIT